MGMIAPLVLNVLNRILHIDNSGYGIGVKRKAGVISPRPIRLLSRSYAAFTRCFCFSAFGAVFVASFLAGCFSVAALTGVAFTLSALRSMIKPKFSRPVNSALPFLANAAFKDASDSAVMKPDLTAVIISPLSVALTLISPRVIAPLVTLLSPASAV